jgi:hypothetical protein
VGRPELVLNNPIISVGVMSQMQTLRDLVAVPNSSGRGLVDRFLIAAPADYVGYRNLNPEQLSETVKHAYATLLASYVSGLWNAEGSYTLTLSEDASTVLGLFDHEVEVRLRAQGDLRHLGGFGNKLVGQSTRYAAIHHLATYGITGAFSHPVGADSMAWGVAVAEWSVEHYRYAVAAAGETGDLSDAERVLRWLKNRSDKTATVTQRHVYKTCNLGTKDRAQAALELLRDHNWVREARERKVAGQGRPPTVWQVHPSLVDEG